MLPSILDSIIPKRRDPQDDDPLNVAPQAADNTTDGSAPVSAPDPNIQGTDALIPRPYAAPDSASQAYNVAPQADSAASAAVSKASTPPDSTPPDTTQSSPYKIAPMAMSSVTAPPPSMQSADAIIPRPYTPMPDGGPIDPLSASGGADQSPKITPQAIPAGIDAAPMADRPTMKVGPQPPTDANGQPLSPVEAAKAKLNDLYTNGVPRHKWYQRLAEGALRGLGTGNFIGGAVEGISEAASPKLNERIRTNQAINKTRRQIADNQAIDLTAAKTQEIPAREDRLTAKDESMGAAKKRADLIKVYRDLPDFDPQDPENQDLVQQSIELGVPLPPKSAKTSFKYLTDAKTGKVYVDQNDVTGERHLQQLTNDDGSDFTVATPQMMSAEDRKSQRELRDKLAGETNITKVKVAQIGAGSREKVANIAAGSREKVANINSDSRETIASDNRGAVNERNIVNNAAKAAQVLASIENSGAIKGEKPDQTAARKAQARSKFIDSLPPDIQKQIPH